MSQLEKIRKKMQERNECRTTRPEHIIYKFPMQQRVLSSDYGVYDYWIQKDLRGNNEVAWLLRFYTSETK